ncbi:hypothetical protein BGW80DRAFT_1260874 [Lactifluus volemus]|nr:hypothetical protein BGW80DRAFT_1260874 [Lactifluus volemus]
MQQMRTLAGPDASVAFTNLSHAACASLSTAFASSSSVSSSTQQLAQTECHEQGVLALMQARGIVREQVCLLDPKSPEPLAPSDGDGNSNNADSDDAEPDPGKSKFKWFLFGSPPKFVLVDPQFPKHADAVRLATMFSCHVVPLPTATTHRLKHPGLFTPHQGRWCQLVRVSPSRSFERLTPATGAIMWRPPETIVRTRSDSPPKIAIIVTIVLEGSLEHWRSVGHLGGFPVRCFQDSEFFPRPRHYPPCTPTPPRLRLRDPDFNNHAVQAHSFSESEGHG